MVSWQCVCFCLLPNIPMVIIMASGLGSALSSKLQRIPTGIPMTVPVFLWAFLWLVAQGVPCPPSYDVFQKVFLRLLMYSYGCSCIPMGIDMPSALGNGPLVMSVLKG